MLTVDVRYWVEKKWVWFTNIRGELTYMSSLNDVPLITIHVSDDFYFKLTDDAELTYIYSKGERSLFIEPA